MSSVPADQAKPPLRRATYIHVSDLTSAYNIDHARLEEELNRVKAERDEANSLLAGSGDKGETAVDPSSVETDLDVSLGSSPQKRLQPPRGGYNLCVLIGKVNVVVDKFRVDSSRVRLAEVEIGDETGTVSLRARDEQIDVLKEVSARSGAVVLRNCTLELYQGKHIRLAVTKWGKLCVYPDNVASTPPPPSKMNMDRNFSLIDLSIVAREMVDVQLDGSFSNKQSRGSDESPDASGRNTPSKGSGQGYGKLQTQSGKSRNTRDRRQSRGKSGNAPQGHYGGPTGDRGLSHSQASQMRYHGHNFPRYEQHGFQSYVHGGQQDVLSPASAQHLLLHHQYESQQRQFHQMYVHAQQDILASNIAQVQPPGMMLQPMPASGSFEYNTSGSDHHQAAIPMVGSNQVLMPVGLANSQVQHGMPSVTQKPYAAHDGKNVANYGAQSPSMPRVEQTHHVVVSPDESKFPHGNMNPDAIAFAPTYMNPQGATPQTSSPAYFPAYNVLYSPQATQASTEPSMPIPTQPHSQETRALPAHGEEINFSGKSPSSKEDMK